MSFNYVKKFSMDMDLYFEEQAYGKNIICLPREYMQESDGRVYYEGYSK